MRLPELDDLITVEEIRSTAAGIAEWQLPNGMIPWFPGGHADPWNHIEAAMALDVAGFHKESVAAYEWLIRNQRSDGAWHQYYLADGIEQDKLDANCIAYIATGAWHHFLVSDDQAFLEELWPVVESAIDFVLGLQEPRGEIRWARHADGTPWSFALLTGSSSVCHSLRAAITIAEYLGHERPDWELSAARLAHVIRTDPSAFAPKDRWAMDWYYPVISGALSRDEALHRLADRRDEFVITGKGVRCVNDRAWVTAAETCEATLAYLCVGDRATAIDLFAWSQQLRDSDGRYWTGRVFPQEVHFPPDEKSSYTSAAVILAADALAGASPAAGLFTDHDFLPALIDIDNAIDEPSLD